MASHPDQSMGLRPTVEVRDYPTTSTPAPSGYTAFSARRQPVLEAYGALAAGTFLFSIRVPAVAAVVGIGDVAHSCERDRRRLIEAIFDPRVAPASQESWDA